MPVTSEWSSPRAGGPEERPHAPPVVALAASAGSLDALVAVLASLPASFPAAVVVCHSSPPHRSDLADILGRRTALRVKEAEEGDMLFAGVAYIVPPDRRLLLNADGTLSLSQAAKAHFVRPSAEPTLQSLAAALQEQAVVLAGGGRDGLLGVCLVKRAGGTVITQDEASRALGMPGAAIATRWVDVVLALGDVAPVLAGLAGKWDAAA